MPLIAPVNDDPARAAAQSIFREYALFLRATQSCGTFNFPRFDEEIAALPSPYSDRHGEVLLASIDDVPAACIAYRATLDHSATCEIKRLCVHPRFRGRGLARTLVAEAISRATARGFTHAILDTDVINMPAAHALYLSFGFREYGSREGNIAFFERSLI